MMTKRISQYNNNYFDEGEHDCLHDDKDFNDLHKILQNSFVK